MTSPNRLEQRAAALLTIVFVGLLLVVPMATPAAAHTALLGTEPASGSRLAYPPDAITLTFATPVDPQTVTASLRSAEGEEIALTLETATGQESDTIVLGVPRLPHGVYGMSWQSVGADGHRVVGEVLFGVGVAADAAEVAGAGVPLLTRVLDGAALLGRIGWYLAIALLAGMAVLAGTGRPEVRGVVAAWSRRILLLGAGAALVRGVAAAAIRADVGAGLASSVLTRASLGWVLAALLLAAAAVRPTGLLRPPDRGLMRSVAGGRLAPNALVLLSAAVLLGAVAGHALSRPDPILALVFGVTHLLAAALWTGPLLLLVTLVMTSPGWRELEPAERASTLRAAIVPIAATAGWALVAVGVTGGLLALRALDGITTGFAVALGAKSAVVGLVAIPLGIWHHRSRERWSSVPPTLRVEAAGLVVALALGGVLVGWDPGWTGGGQADPALAALLDGGEIDPSSCAQLDVGRATCLRTSLESVMVADGPQAAIDQIGTLSTTDDYVIRNCHQVAHDLGNDAADRITDMAEALAVEGSVCWSGYYHGFVEARLAEFDDAALTAELPSFCDGAATTRYSFTHYNCLHGLGHGLMLRYDADLFQTLPLCEELAEFWEERSCASGAFMENIIAAQQGLEVPGLDDADLLYPCTGIDGPLSEDCYLMQTSHVLWTLQGDLEAAFELCDTVDGSDREACYRSMGRDISSGASLDGQLIVERCSLGDPEFGGLCINGAAANAVYEQAGPEAANALCNVVPDEWLRDCTDARDQALSIVAAG